MRKYTITIEDGELGWSNYVVNLYEDGEWVQSVSTYSDYCAALRVAEQMIEGAERTDELDRRV